MKRKSETLQPFHFELKKWVDYWKPDNPLEQELVESLSRHDWLLNKAKFAQQLFLSQGDSASAPDSLLQLRYGAAQQHACSQLMSTLHDLRDFQTAEEIGFVSQKSTKMSNIDSSEDNPWMRVDSDPATEEGWADPITGKFTPFGDGFAAELAEDEAREEAERKAEEEENL